MDYQWIHEAHAQQHTWLLKRNCALAPRQLAACFGLLSLLSLTIAGFFVAYGAWYVLVFALIEVSALGLAFVVYGRYAADYDRVSFSPSQVVVERVRAGRLERVKLDPLWLRVEYAGQSSELVELVSGKSRVSVGRFVPHNKRLDLKQELLQSLRSMLSGGVRFQA